MAFCSSSPSALTETREHFLGSAPTSVATSSQRIDRDEFIARAHEYVLTLDNPRRTVMLLYLAGHDAPSISDFVRMNLQDVNRLLCLGAHELQWLVDRSR